MKKIILFALFAGLLLAAAKSPIPEAEAVGSECHRKSFETELIKNACNKGGQNEAKKACKKFMRIAKKANIGVHNCKSCHSTLKPEFNLKSNGLDLFKQAGGK